MHRVLLMFKSHTWRAWKQYLYEYVTHLDIIHDGQQTQSPGLAYHAVFAAGIIGLSD